MNIESLVATYGYLAVAGLVGLESTGVPVPGETALIAAAIYAGTTHRLSIAGVIAAAAAGAILGDSLGFWIGRRFGYPLLLRYGQYLRLTETRIKLGQYFVRRQGGTVVFFGRFVAVLRALAAVLAGASAMSWRRFLAFNAGGGVTWSLLYGGGAYSLGEGLNRVAGSLGMAVLGLAGVAAGVGLVVGWWYEASWEVRAEQAIPGPPLGRLSRKGTGRRRQAA